MVQETTRGCLGSLGLEFLILIQTSVQTQRANSGFSISKLSNKQIGTAVVEACQQVHHSHRISRRLKLARQEQPKEIIDIADKCIRRLRKKWFHLYQAGKQKNKIKVACAREYLSFIWEALQVIS